MFRISDFNAERRVNSDWISFVFILFVGCDDVGHQIKPIERNNWPVRRIDSTGSFSCVPKTSGLWRNQTDEPVTSAFDPSANYKVGLAARIMHLHDDPSFLARI